MGNYGSKFFFQNAEDTNVKNTLNNDQTNSLKVCDSFTPVTARKKLVVDPRSATAEISRTPIEVNYTPLRISRKAISAIPKHLQIRSYLENIGTTTSKCIDPRSPTIDLQRTPISATNVVSYPNCINKFENQLEELTPTDYGQYVYSKLDPRSPSVHFDRTPILIPKPDKNGKMKSESEDLNTQIEENNTIQSKFHFCETVTFNTLEIQALINETMDEIKYFDANGSNYISTADESELHRNKDTDDDEQGSYRTNVQNETTEVKNFKVWRDSISENSKQSSINEPDSLNATCETFSQIVKENIEINEIKDVSICAPFEYNSKNIQDTSENKKLKLNGSTGTNGKNFIRTPLRNRCTNGQFDIVLTKSPQHALQNKSLNIVTQQENTPPHKKHNSKSKVKGIQWDTNSTVII